MSETEEQAMDNTKEASETQKTGEKSAENVAAEEQQSTEAPGEQPSDAPADGEGSAGEKSEEQPPVVEGETPKDIADVGEAKEEGAADTEKAKKLNDDDDVEGEKKAGSGEGEAEKTEETLVEGEGESSEEAKPSDSGEVIGSQAGGKDTVEGVADDAVDSEKIEPEAGGEKTETEVNSEDKADGQEAGSSEQQPSSAEPPLVSVEEGGEEKVEEQPSIVSVEGEEKKTEPESPAAATEEKKDGSDEKKEKEEEEEEMVFDYDYEQLKSTPEMINVTTSDMLTLFHSFGYECEKRSNLVVLAKDMVVYAAGNLVVLLDLDSQQQTCIRSLGGGGIGALAVHPSQAYFAVGEKGTKPAIVIYTYPDLKLHRMLRDGTEEMYSHMDFSPGDGNLLASVGGNPDYMLTVWDWEREKTVLRSKAFSQDIYRVTFSPENANQLTTSGTGHIRFWKMATTFTGLKLQGQLGKFGRIEISDISAYVELPDGKVLSGTEWGNMLLWDGGFIKVEISRKGKKYCHNGMIEAIYLDEGELISTGVDGYVRVWDFETIDNADITDENVTFEMDPLTEIKIGHDVSLKTLSRSVDADTPTLWYAQDAGGAIWKIDIVTSHTRKAPEKLMSFHSGEITGLDCSPLSYQAASISHNGSVRVYDLPSKQLLCHSQYTSGGSSLIWAPVTVDPSATTIFAGFTDGVVRILRLEERATTSARHRGQQKYQLTLLNAVKPHTKPVSSLAVDREGKVLASGSKDNTVFFLNVQDKYSPIGFIHTPAPVTTMRWSSGDKSDLYLLVCCEDGSMMEVSPPDKAQYDTSKTYHLSELKYTARKFTSIKDRLRDEEEEAHQAAERERKRKEKEARKQRRREELGEDYVSEEEEEEEEREGEGEGEGEGEAPPTEAAEKPKGPSSILSTFFDHQDESKFWVSMSGYDAGYLYECCMDGAEQESQPYESPHTVPVPTINEDDLPLHSMTFSSSGEYLLTGASNGCIRIHQLEEPHSLANLTSHWSLAMHDNHYGAVTHLVTSFDDKYVLSGGADGNLFVFEGNFPSAEERAQAALEAKIPSESGISAKDIEDPDHYSVEDAKQKAEHDRMIKLAEEKKQHVRRQIASLRRTFTKLQQKAAQLPEHLRLDKKEFVMDPDMEVQMKAQAECKIELVKKQMAWETEKHNIALKKLKTKYKDIIDCERITVYSFCGEKQVSSFRTTHPSPAFLKMIEELNSADSVATPSTAAAVKKKRISVRKVSVHGGVEFTDEEGEGSASGEDEEEEGEGLIQDKRKSKQEARRLKKERRKKEWKELYQNKPDDKQDDPEEARLLEQARENLGDYKLKTASDYVVPEHQRVTTKKKRQQLLTLRAQIFDTKKEYNKKLIALRDWKLQIVDKIAELVKRLEELHTKLPPSLHKPIPPVPVIRPDEVPEKRFEYTTETLLKFKEEKKARDEAERLAAMGAGDGFFGGFGGGGGEGEGEGGNGDKDKKEGEGGEEQDGAQSQEDAAQDTQEAGEVEVAGEEESEATDSRRPSLSQPQAEAKREEEEGMTEIERIIKKEQEIRNDYEQGCLLAEVEQLKRYFDEALSRLRHDKVQLDIDMVSAELKHITQFEELQLLKEFEKKETIFTSRYKNRKQEKQDLESKMEEVMWSVSARESTLNKLIEQEKALEQSFLEAIGENNKFKDFLLKVFRKKIKRAKRKQQEEVSKEGGAEGDEEEGSEDESDSDYLSSSEDESQAEGELDDSICPAGCDHALFDQACAMREKRLDMEDSIAEEKKALESQKKELESLKKKAKTMDVHVKTALSELQAFQLKKQQRLNELDQVAVLRLHQILHHGKDGEPPTSIDDCLVFPASALEHLEQRIGELTGEKQQEKKRYKELRHRYVKLNREKKEMQAKITELNDKANEAMMLKFGRVVDLDRLEGLSVNHIVEGLRAKLRKVEQKRERDVSAIEAQINAQKRKLAAVTRENTEKLNRLHELRTAKERLDQRLNARQKSMSKDVAGGESHLDEEEKQRLVQIVRIQGSEIDSLRQEIQLLLRKGGHILPPSQPPAGPMHPASPGTMPPIH